MTRIERKILAERQAHDLMLRFIGRRYNRTASDDLALLLGSASLLEDGSPADPALAEEWHEGVAVVLEAQKNGVAVE